MIKDMSSSQIGALVGKVRSPGSGLEIKDRKQLFTTYPSCFSSNDFIDWLIKSGECTSKEDGIMVANSLLARGLMYCIGSTYLRLLDLKDVPDVDLQKIIQNLSNQATCPVVRDRKSFLHTYKNSLTGAECVDWLMSNVPKYAPTRKEAESLGQWLINVGVLAGSKKFVDNSTYFQLAQEPGAPAPITVTLLDERGHPEKEQSRISSSLASPVTNKLPGLSVPPFKFQNQIQTAHRAEELEPHASEYDMDPFVMIEPTSDSNTCSTGCGSVLHGRVASTYPLKSESGTARDGDPVCDTIGAVIFPQSVVFALADGCSWGKPSREAAHRAISGFLSFMSRGYAAAASVLEAEALLASAFSAAHSAIIADCPRDWWSSGTTTLIGGIIVRKKRDKQLAIICASVGDCTGFTYSKGKVREINTGTRNFISDPRDCGGRLGPQQGEGQPDLRNLQIFYNEVSVGDIVIFMSDGVHDNLDPSQLGVGPSDLGLAATSWDEAATMDRSSAMDAKDKYSIKLMETLLGSDHEKINVEFVTNELTKQALKATEKVRSHMEKGLKKGTTGQPTDQKEYPGKLDHVSCLAILVKDDYSEELRTFSDSQDRQRSSSVLSSPYL